MRNIFKQENIVLQLTFNAELASTGFRKTRPRSPLHPDWKASPQQFTPPTFIATPIHQDIFLTACRTFIIFESHGFAIRHYFKILQS